MIKAETIFKNYNKAISRVYKKIFSDMDNNESEDGFIQSIDDLKECVREELTKWENTSFDEIGGITPLEYFNGINDFEKLVELFKIGAVICDDSMPEALLNKLKSFGDKAVESMMELAFGSEGLNLEEDKSLIALNAIKVLGLWKLERAVGKMIDMLFTLPEHDDELFKESIRESLVNIGLPSVDPIIGKLETAQDFTDAHEYLMMALADIGAGNKSDKIYRCLKSAFLRMQNKILGASCLATYGDGRAIPALRGYIEKNRNTIDMETFFEIKSAIDKLGGTTDDLIFIG
ncbi:MAG TPA: hypothetical protein GXX14_02960 [Clostridiaceae bacterium]|nr:hypothetical protein [Clostridiaceae bacterium]